MGTSQARRKIQPAQFRAEALLSKTPQIPDTEWAERKLRKRMGHFLQLIYARKKGNEQEGAFQKSKSVWDSDRARLQAQLKGKMSSRAVGMLKVRSASQSWAWSWEETGTWAWTSHMIGRLGQGGTLVLAEPGYGHCCNHKVPFFPERGQVISATSCSHQAGFKGHGCPSRNKQ